jgi:DNA-binding NarL/FixJ family response regulator
MAQISVAVVESQRTFADALASRLGVEADLRLVAVVESAAAGRRLLEGRHVDIALIDSELTPAGGILAEVAGIRAVIPPPVRVILLGPVPEPAHTVQALRTGIAGWVPKEESIEQLLGVIHGVMRDEIWLPATAMGPVLRLLVRELGGQEDCPKHPLESLTPREREVLAYLVAGVGRRETAERLHLSAHTVRSHLQNLMGKLGVHTTLEAVAVARQAQLSSSGSPGSSVWHPLGPSVRPTSDAGSAHRPSPGGESPARMPRQSGHRTT